MSTATDKWSEANKRYLMMRLAAVRAALVRHADQADSPVDAPAPEAIARFVTAMEEPPALDVVVDLFRLSPFERDTLLLCAGVELDAEFAPLCAAAQGDAQRNYPSFSLALAALPDAHWSALSPGSSLRYWNLLHIEPGRSLTRTALTVDERILHYLVGVNHLDKELAGRLRQLPSDEALVPSHELIAREIAATWERTDPSQRPAVFQLGGFERAGKRALATVACRRFGLKPYLLPAVCLPTDPNELERLRRLWEREAVLGAAVLILDCDSLDAHDQQRRLAVTRFVEDCFEPMVVLTTHRLDGWQRPVISFEVDKPTAAERRSLWQAALGPGAESINGALDQIVSQFHVTGPVIAAVLQDTAGRLAERGSKQPLPQETVAKTLWDVCRRQARPQLDDLAQRIEPAAGWDDLILPHLQKGLLREIGAHVRYRGLVYERWGFQRKGNRGLGISALFAGASGTGKTMAAEVLAGELNLDLYRIDLSSVVSKYIGETEKNLRRVFDAAEGGGAILLFDEADALFGKRSEVKDSHDRHANIEVSYLLQRMETYRGLAILTTNLKDALDQAFLRRIRFVVSFPFPDETDRARIWQRIYPADTPIDGLDWRKLAKLNIAGGNIRNIALHAAFSAADAGESIGMKNILQAAHREYAKLERTLTATEVTDWI